MAHAVVWLGLPLCLSLLLVSYFPAYSLFLPYTWTSLGLFVVTLILRLFYVVVLYPKFFTPFKHIPCPPGRSIWNGHQRHMDFAPPGSIMASWAHQIPNNGLLRFYMVGNMERLLTTNPKALADLLVHKNYDFKKTDLIQFMMKKITGQGIFLVEGAVHKTQRRNLMPAFAHRHIKELYPVFWQKGIEMVDAMEKSIKSLPDGKKVTVIGDWSRSVTLDIIGLAGMGHDFHCIRNPGNPLEKAFFTVLRQPLAFARLIVLISFFVNPAVLDYLPLKQTKVTKKATETLRSFAREIIMKKKMELQAADPTENLDIISIAIESGAFSDESLANQVLTFLAAGHETTSTTIQYAIYSLCRHPEVQTRLRDEIRSNLPSTRTNNGTPPVPITAAQIDSLPYLNAVCNEVLRYYPPAPVTMREAIRDTTLVDTFVPKGTVVAVSMELLNRDPVLWGPDADTFNPDRWMGPGRANTGGAANNYAFLTFFHGPRSCIGSGFARGEIACLLAVMVARLEFELEDPDKKLEVREGPAITPKDGVRVKAKVVEGW